MPERLFLKFFNTGDAIGTGEFSEFSEALKREFAEFAESPMRESFSSFSMLLRARESRDSLHRVIYFTPMIRIGLGMMHKGVGYKGSNSVRRVH